MDTVTKPWILLLILLLVNAGELVTAEKEGERDHEEVRERV